MRPEDVNYTWSKGLFFYKIEAVNKKTKKKIAVAIIPRWIPNAELLAMNTMRGLEILKMFSANDYEV